MTSIPNILKECRAGMEKGVEATRREFASVRSGKSSPNMLDTVRVELYGTAMQMNQVGQVSAPEPRLLLVTPFDKSQIKTIEKAIRESGLGLDPVTASAGILRLANVKMAHAIRAITIEQGLDPRDFSLVAYGGAGPLHAAALARELSIPVVLIPPHPAHFSAWGMLFADLRHDFVQTAPGRLEQTNLEPVNAHFVDMIREGHELLIREGMRPEQMSLVRSIDLRYVGQEHTISLPVEQELLTRDDAVILRGRFDELHKSTYGYDAPDVEVEIVNLRLTALGRIQPPRLVHLPEGPQQPSAEAERGTRKVYFAERQAFIDSPVYHRDTLRAGNVIVGPALIEEYATTTVVYPGDRLVVNPYGLLELQIR